MVPRAHDDYELLDSGRGRKLERFGDVVLSRPCGQADWEQLRPGLWANADASFDRGSGWVNGNSGQPPASWTVSIHGITLKLELTPSGHLGVFPETRHLWDWITAALSTPETQGANILNLFAYTGGATLAAARAGSSVCHVDASRSMVRRAQENSMLNQLGGAPIRWIVDDVGKFLTREIRRGRRYDAIFLDPPSFGHGTKGEQYRAARDLSSTLEQCRMLLAEKTALVMLTSHTLGATPAQLEDEVRRALGPGAILSGEMILSEPGALQLLPDGIWVRWSR